MNAPQLAARSHGPVRGRSAAAVSTGAALKVHTLQNRTGMTVRVTNYGGIILSLIVPDRMGRPGDVVLGYDSPEDYADNPPYFGAIIGRYANRIAHGRFMLDSATYELATNERPHHLHGGRRGFDSVVWETEGFRDDGDPALLLRYTSPAGEEGYPGTLVARVRYTVTDENQLVIEYGATTDAPTHLNLTQHSYFNLGEQGADILDHVVTMDAEAFLPVDETLIPTGEVRAVAGTPFDFREPTAIGARIDDADPQLDRGSGYDHCMVLTTAADGSLRWAARVHEPRSGRVLDVHTTEPGVQLYTGNHLNEERGKNRVRYGPRSGLALETQHFPDSPNRPAFPSTVLRPGERYESRTVYTFGVLDPTGSGVAA